MATTSDISTGSFVRHNNELCVILELQHRTPGKGQAVYQAKMRNVRTGRLVEQRFRSGETVDIVRVDHRELQFIYREADSLVCMDTETFEQLYIQEILFGDGAQFLKEEMMVKVSFDDETPVMAELPTVVEVKITYTEPGLRGDTATKTLKPATIETGATVNVPLFCNIDEMIRVDTRTGAYIERVK